MAWNKGQSGNPGGRRALPPEFKNKLSELNRKTLQFWDSQLTPDAEGNYGKHAFEISQMVSQYVMGKPPESTPESLQLVDSTAVNLSESELLRIAEGVDVQKSGSSNEDERSTASVQEK